MAAQLGQAAQPQPQEAWLQAKPSPLLPLSRMLHACRAAAAKSAIPIALPATDVRDDGPLAHGSCGSARATALELLPLQSDDLRGLQAARRGTRCVTAHDGGSDRGQGKVVVRWGWLRTSRSSKLIKSEVPKRLETERDLESDLVSGPRAPTAPRRCHASWLSLWPPQTTRRLMMAARVAWALPSSRV